MLTVRPARLPDDKPAILRFIEALQGYEAVFESDRHLYPAYAEDQFTALQKQTENGIFLIAEREGTPLGWAAIYEHTAPLYVVPEQRVCAVVCELYVDEAARGHGVCKALLAAAEEWARGRNIAVLQIGHLAENRLASAAYDKCGFDPYVVLRRKKLRP
jgi:GNAT superfamily N-acetyltransferase